MADFLDREEEAFNASAFVAPLVINKSPQRKGSEASRHTRQSSSRSRRTTSIRSQSQSQISPPLTPRTSREAFAPQTEPQPVFHNYLRAFYHFHPTSTVSSSTDESSITVPINQGDVILVHSVHPNGWADGTLLASGARGWLPTNYCEAYDHPSIRNLLTALTHLWDLVRDGENGDLVVFSKQDYVRSMIAGVRFFLEKSQCLTRESPLIQAHVGLRRMRKGLLGDLSSLVKTAKKLQEMLQSEQSTVTVFELLDELVLRAFKLVTRAVRFLDIWAQDAVAIPFDLSDGSNRPPTPPVDFADPELTHSRTLSNQNAENGSAFGHAATVSQANPATTQEELEGTRNQPPRSFSRASVAFTIPSEPDSLQSPLLGTQPQGQAKRLSITHRLSYTGKSQGLRKQNLASERLNAAHDSFLGFIGSFIGLHLQSRSSSELLLTTQQSVTACRQLLAVVNEVWERDSRRSDQLEQARDMMYTRLAELVQATKEMFSSSESPNGDDVFMPDSGKQLVTAATSCVRSAGECVTKARFIIENIGDFEFEHSGLGISDVIMEGTDKSFSQNSVQNESLESVETEKPLPPPPEPTMRPPPPPLLISESKPLPEPPAPSPIPNLEPSQHPIIVESPTAASFRSSRSSLPPLSQLPTPHFPQPSPSDPSQSPASATHRLFGKTARADSVNVSVADSNSTYPSSVRGDTASIISQASTRATTPDHSPTIRNSEKPLMNSFGSASELRSLASEEATGVEEQLLETTFAHELVYNKEGQISGGSLPALVEQLTTHESTPDAMFVTTFYLTFRLFTTPVDFAQSLIDRFDYIGESQEIGIPVRLRVYNVFKGWLESHWQADMDPSALGLILNFATGKLRAALPAAGKRLAELTAKVTEVHAGALVPRLVSSIGKTGVSSTVYSAVDSNAPTPIISKSQLNALKNARNGVSQCSILDFDPLELARQFTIIESKIFCSIQPEELLGSEWTKKTTSKALNVRAMSTLSTDLANLVADTILFLEDPKKRAVIIKHWVKIAMKCLELNNYDSLMAIICSLNSSMVLRLKRTWELVSQKTKGRLDELKVIVDVGRNYAVLRQRLQNHVAPCIPFVGIYLTDLTFVDVGNQTTRQLPGDGSREGVSVINFDKHMRTAKIIGQLQSFQVPYRLIPVPEMQDWMESQIQRVRSSDQANVQSYYRRSLLLEPREPAPVIKPSPQVDSSAQSTFSASSREGSRDRFDFLSNFSFSSTSTVKDR
ncbi:ras guanine-nucleotide exchange protein-like protein [Lepidopterella palustris CBS 459.81]|uniref:Ras guanine-nucleotide exchange protein-like protein n=1 Tax=Lepidopterella palustris CBS 459.81 TaxID=1314670 RepID=A0A8E2JD26_9PEZI|nr:ras guanine-nucleotide exchange protein-like protein [Lepidopterella palustris CBS 459.81]